MAAYDSGASVLVSVFPKGKDDLNQNDDHDLPAPPPTWQKIKVRLRWTLALHIANVECVSEVKDSQGYIKTESKEANSTT